MRVASAAGAAKQMVEPPAAGQKCRVWTASYGGQKAMIIRSLVDKVVNYTVMVPQRIERQVTVPVCTMVPKQVTYAVPPPCGGCGW